MGIAVRLQNVSLDFQDAGLCAVSGTWWSSFALAWQATAQGLMLSDVLHSVTLYSWDSLVVVGLCCQDPLSGKVDRRTLLRGSQLSGVSGHTEIYGVSRMDSKALLERPGRGLSGQRCVPGPGLSKARKLSARSGAGRRPLCTRLKMQPVWLLAVALSGALNLNALSGSWIQCESGVTECPLPWSLRFHSRL